MGSLPKIQSLKCPTSLIGAAKQTAAPERHPRSQGQPPAGTGMRELTPPELLGGVPTGTHTRGCGGAGGRAPTVSKITTEAPTLWSIINPTSRLREGHTPCHTGDTNIICK